MCCWQPCKAVPPHQSPSKWSLSPFSTTASLPAASIPEYVVTIPCQRRYCLFLFLQHTSQVIINRLRWATGGKSSQLGCEIFLEVLIKKGLRAVWAKGEFTGKLGCSSICAALNQTIWKVSNGREHCCETVWLATFTEMFTEINHALPGFKMVISLNGWSHILLQCHFHFSSDVPPFSAQGPFTVQLWHFHFPFRVPSHSAQVT